MANKKLTAATLPQLCITPQDEAELRQLRAQLQHEVLAEYEEFHTRHRREVDTSRWSHVKSEGDLHSYRERSGALFDDKHVNSSANDAAALRPQAALAFQSRLSRVLVTGSVAGSLDDVMLGYTFRDTESLRAHWACQNGFMDDSAVLAELEGPTERDPYRFFGVTWFLRTFKLPAVLLHNRDCVCLSSTQLTTLANGERVAVAFHHSVRHSQMPGLNEFSTVRAVASLLRVFRQLDADRVEVFLLHFLDTKGSVPDSFHLQESVKGALPSTTRFYDAGIHKKLLWVVRQRSYSQNGFNTEPVVYDRDNSCDLCAKSLGGIFGSAGSTCYFCRKHACSRCSVPQDIIIDTRTSRTVTHRFSFCLRCFLSVKKLPALQTATDIALRQQQTPIYVPRP